MNWTDERVERLKRLWAEGLSASQIAAQLGGVSRNAVIGKVHRLNLPGRAKSGGTVATGRNTAKRTTSTPRAPNYASRVATTRAVIHTAGSTAVKEEMAVDTVQDLAPAPRNNVVVPISRQLSLTDLTERTCKWPVGDPLKDDFHFCGCESPDASPYCNYHARLAYQPAHDRRRAAVRA
jgi:GcrA cell cycle regulator